MMLMKRTGVRATGSEPLIAHTDDFLLELVSKVTVGVNQLYVTEYAAGAKNIHVILVQHTRVYAPDKRFPNSSERI